MAVTVRIPTTLRTLTGGTSSVEVAGTNVGEVLAALEEAHPGFRERILATTASFDASSTCSSATRTCATLTACPRRYPTVRRWRSSRRWRAVSSRVCRVLKHGFQ